VKTVKFAGLIRKFSNSGLEEAPFTASLIFEIRFYSHVFMQRIFGVWFVITAANTSDVISCAEQLRELIQTVPQFRVGHGLIFSSTNPIRQLTDPILSNSICMFTTYV